MTPIAGVIIAVLAAWLAPNARAVVISALVLLCAATLAQTWDLGADWGSNPPNTIRQASYWVVQAVIAAIVVALALGMFRLRARRAARSGRSLARPTFSGRRGWVILLSCSIAMTVALLATEYGIYKATKHHGRGAGHIPWTGVIGIAAGLAVLLGTAIALIRSVVSDHRVRTRPQTTRGAVGHRAGSAG
jgi:heme/copper-type cytochrome/quinol oxidase subunit 2